MKLNPIYVVYEGTSRLMSFDSLTAANNYVKGLLLNKGFKEKNMHIYLEVNLHGKR
jgi:hypothetical protein